MNKEQSGLFISYFRLKISFSEKNSQTEQSRDKKSSES